MTRGRAPWRVQEGFSEQVFTAECSLNASGDVLYVADRVWPPVPGKDDGLLATFGVGPGGVMDARGHTKVGRHPRHFKIDPTGQWMICTALHEHRVRKRLGFEFEWSFQNRF